MLLTNQDQRTSTPFSPHRAAEVLNESGILDGLPVMVAMAKNRFSHPMEKEGSGLATLACGTTLFANPASESDGGQAESEITDLTITQTAEGHQVWEFALPCSGEAHPYFAYRILVDEDSAEVLQVDVGSAVIKSD